MQGRRVRVSGGRAALAGPEEVLFAVADLRNARDLVIGDLCLEKRSYNSRNEVH